MHRETLRADLLLLIVAAIWGSGFVAQRAAMESMGPFLFTSARFWIGALVLVPIVLWRGSGRGWTREIRGGLTLGLVMTAAAGAQQMGLVTTTASRAGFITGLYVLGVPAIGLLLGQAVRTGHMVGAAIAAAGLVLLSGDLAGGIVTGDLLVLLCAGLWALHVVLIGQLAPRADPVRLAFVQFVVVGLVAGLLAGVLERDQELDLAGALLPLSYSGVFAIGVAFTLQIVAQRSAPATHAAVLMSLESVFGAVFGVLLLAERLAPAEIAGCTLMLAGCLVSQLWPHRRSRAERDELIDPVR